MYEQEMAEKNCILKLITGAHLYGTNTENSDKDYVGVFIPDKDYVLGLKECERVEQRTNPTSSGKRNTKDDVDIVYYSLPKFIKLAMGANPNIIELLYAPNKCILYKDDFGQGLIDNRDLFVSKKVKHTFLGYAYAQKQKLLTKQPEGGRLEYIEKFGYDVKFASHLIRLLTEGMEFLVEGKVTLPLPNNQYVRDIKIGKHKLEDVLAAAQKYEDLVEQAYVNSKLQATPKIDMINQLQIHMLESYWKR
jgi:predicted nucleotidyltransferase